MRIYISQEIPRALRKRLDKYGDVVLLPPFSRLASGVACHADMLMFHSSVTGRVVLHEDYYKENADMFCGLEVLTACEEICPQYPHDILLDCCKMGKYLFCNEKYTALAAKEGYTVINVKQGYAGCSVLRVNENAMISADRGICKRAVELGIDALNISEGGIILEGYSCGFIGGASLVLGDEVLFFGDVTKHTSYNEIVDFLKKYDMKVEYIEDIPLTDYGSAVVLDEAQYSRKKERVLCL